MEWGNISQWFGKYKYALGILMLGICLMLIPEKEENPQPQTAPLQEVTMAQQLQQILSQIEGAGRVEVLLSEALGASTLYQTDIQKDQDAQREALNEKTVIITDSDRVESGLVIREDPPVYLGAIIACQGADSAQVRLAIVEAVRCATGLGANQIAVVKMK